MKNTIFKKIIAICLGGALALSLAACGKGGNGGGIGGFGGFGGGSGNGGNGNGSAVADSSISKEGVFSYKTIDLGLKSDDSGYSDIQNVFTYEDKGYICYYTYNYNESVNRFFVAELTKDGEISSKSELQLPELDTTIPEGVEDGYTSVGIDNVVGGDGRIYGAINGYCSYTDTNGEYVNKNQYYLAGWDLNGNLLWSINLSDKYGFDYFYINSSCAYPGGVCFLAYFYNEADHNMFLTLDKDGNFTKEADLGTNISFYRLLALKDGGFAVFSNDENYNTVIKRLDLNSMQLGDVIPVPSTFINNGGNAQIGTDTDFICRTNSGIGKFNIGDETVTTVMNSINSDLSSYGVDNFAFFDKDNFIGTYYDSALESTVVGIFTYVDPSTIPDKTILTLATYYLDYDVRNRVIEYNKNSSEYRIVIKDYSEYSTQEDWQAGYTRLNNDLLSGNLPDIMYINPGISSLDLLSLAKKNLLVDISELIKNDPELGQYTYLDNVFDAFAVNGKHYVCVPAFSVGTFISSTDYVGDRSNLTVDEFLDIMKSRPDAKFSDYTTRSNFIYNIMSYNGTEFIDPATGKCAFDSDEFVKLLEYAGTLPEEQNYDDMEIYADYYDQYRNGKVIFLQTNIYDLPSYRYQQYSAYGEKGTIIGFPSTTGQGCVINTSATPFEIINGKNVQAAWDFAKYCLTPEQQNKLGSGIPVLESAFNAWAAKGMEKPYWEDENHVKQYYTNTYIVDGVEHEIPVMTSEEVEQVKNIIKSTHKTNYNNENINAIVEEEASAFFAGQKTAKDVAGIIQSRAQIYINENN
ncbi:MAG: extracellular solute-binding protein [Lachnospiraceae bacterium]|nr:extracellular solute-binding protein [Lachnospiraceae bacterium]